MADITVTAASVAIQGTGGSLSRVVVGEAVTQGQPGYLNTCGGNYDVGHSFVPMSITRASCMATAHIV